MKNPLVKNLASLTLEYENGLMSEEEVINFFQELINSELAWDLQGHYGRMAKHLIEIGLCRKPGQMT